MLFRSDLNGREWATLLPLVALAFWIGIYPAPLFKVLQVPVDRLMGAVNPGYLNTGAAAPPPALNAAPAPASNPSAPSNLEAK